MTEPPAQPKLYHIVHVDRLPSIIENEHIWCDAKMTEYQTSGTTVGIDSIKQRRLSELRLASHPDLYVGQCVPFYFCPRSIMLYLICQRNHPGLSYRGGQEPIIHIEADLYASVEWANKNKLRWAFTLSNAGAYYFEDRCDLSKLNEINWEAVKSTRWSGNGIESTSKEGKQAEFLLEERFPWCLVERIGVYSRTIYQDVVDSVSLAKYRPRLEIVPTWYY